MFMYISRFITKGQIVVLLFWYTFNLCLFAYFFSSCIITYDCCLKCCSAFHNNKTSFIIIQKGLHVLCQHFIFATAHVVLNTTSIWATTSRRVESCFLIEQVSKFISASRLSTNMAPPNFVRHAPARTFLCWDSQMMFDPSQVLVYQPVQLGISNVHTSLINRYFMKTAGMYTCCPKYLDTHPW